jgi:hypothetical protein
MANGQAGLTKRLMALRGTYGSFSTVEENHCR